MIYLELFSVRGRGNMTKNIWQDLWIDQPRIVEKYSNHGCWTARAHLATVLTEVALQKATSIITLQQHELVHWATGDMKHVVPQMFHGRSYALAPWQCPGLLWSSQSDPLLIYPLVFVSCFKTGLSMIPFVTGWTHRNQLLPPQILALEAAQLKKRRAQELSETLDMRHGDRKM